VGVAVAGVAVGVGKLVGVGAGSSVAGSVVGCIPQADSHRAKVKKKWAFFIVRNYIMPRSQIILSTELGITQFAKRYRK
jgi:hypothetical protein